MNIRLAKESDLSELAVLFRQTVLMHAPKYYTPAQTAAWASSPDDTEQFRQFQNKVGLRAAKRRSQSITLFFDTLKVRAAAFRLIPSLLALRILIIRLNGVVNPAMGVANVSLWTLFCAVVNAKKRSNSHFKISKDLSAM